MKSYTKLCIENIISDISRLAHLKKESKEKASRVFERSKLAEKQIYDSYGIQWRDCKLLEIGCGQDLAYTYVFALNNWVTAIDTQPPLCSPYIQNFWSLLKTAGIYRVARSLIGSIVGKKNQFKQSLLEIMAVKRLRSVSLNSMNASKLKFSDKSFDGVFSFSVFEHIDDPIHALQEVKRVLKHGGVFYLDIHLFTSIHGDHDFRENIPPWNHLRSTGCSYQRPHYVNEVRLAAWKKMLTKTFKKIKYTKIEGELESNSRYLTHEIRKELVEYSEEELLTTTFITIAQKS